MLPDEEPDATITIETEPTETPPPADNTAALDAIQGRIEAVETRITEGLEGEREWTTTTLTSLREEIASIRANLTEIAQGFPAQVQALRDELTLLSQSLQTPVVTVEAEPEIPVVEPSELPAPVDGTPPPASASSALPKGKRRVV